MGPTEYVCYNYIFIIYNRLRFNFKTLNYPLYAVSSGFD